jgi:nucleoside-diphosphate-sugar epimerase
MIAFQPPHPRNKVISASCNGITPKEIDEQEIQHDSSHENSTVSTTDFPNLNAITASDTIFITGATGFLGGAISAELLLHHTPAHLLFLVRSKTQQEGLDRLHLKLSKFGLSTTLLTQITTENVICGDLVDVSKFANDPRLAKVTFVVNSAGVTSFGKNPNIKAVNVDGTLELVRCIAKMPNLRRFIHVSTAMICGVQPPKVVQEDQFPQDDLRHFVPYTESKAEGELLISEVMRGLPFAIVRPTIIVGHTKLGCGPSHSIFWAFRMGDALRLTTAGIDGRIDIVPVDYVASAILHLMAKPTLKNHLYHIGSGLEHSSTFGEIDKAFCSALGRTSSDFHEATVEEAMARKNEYPALFGQCNKRFMQGAVKLYGSFASLNTVFEITRLRSEGAPPPPKFSEYIDKCLNTSSDMTISEQAMTDFE